MPAVKFKSLFSPSKKEIFEADTVFAISGGQVHIVKNGEDVEVEVEMSETSVNEWVEKDDDGVITKHIIVTTED